MHRVSRARIARAALLALGLAASANAAHAEKFVVLKCVVESSNFPDPAPAAGAVYFRRVGDKLFEAWSEDRQSWSENECPAKACATYPAYYEVSWSQDGAARWFEKVDSSAREDARGWVAAYRYFDGEIKTQLKIDRTTGALSAVQTIDTGRDEGRYNKALGQFESTGGFVAHALTRTFEARARCEPSKDPVRSAPAPRF